LQPRALASRASRKEAQQDDYQECESNEEEGSLAANAQSNKGDGENQEDVGDVSHFELTFGCQGFERVVA
jgi:hypothetical protein